MGDAAYGFPTLDETGASILDDFDPDCPESSILQDPNITRAQYDVAYTGTGMESDCCDGSVVPVGGMTHGQQVPRHLFRYVLYGNTLWSQPRAYDRAGTILSYTLQISEPISPTAFWPAT